MFRRLRMLVCSSGEVLHFRSSRQFLSVSKGKDFFKLISSYNRGFDKKNNLFLPRVTLFHCKFSLSQTQLNEKWNFREYVRLKFTASRNLSIGAKIWRAFMAVNAITPMKYTSFEAQIV